VGSESVTVGPGLRRRDRRTLRRRAGRSRGRERIPDSCPAREGPAAAASEAVLRRRLSAAARGQGEAPAAPGAAGGLVGAWQVSRCQCQCQSDSERRSRWLCQCRAGSLVAAASARAQCAAPAGVGVTVPARPDRRGHRDRGVSGLDDELEPETYVPVTRNA
jgi:hypothetical protein